MSRQHQFKAREENILAMAEQLLLESGDGDITLDSLADQLDLAKGTLYKHFSSKDELYLRIIIRYEEQLFEINRIDDCPSAGVGWSSLSVWRWYKDVRCLSLAVQI